MEESAKAKFLLEKLERVLEEVRCPPDQRASCEVSLLQGEAYDWWKLVLKSLGIPNPMTWEFVFHEFKAKYVTDMYRESKWKQFLNMKQRNLPVAEYEKEFNHLSKYAPEAVLTEAFRCRQFEDGLHDSIKRYLALMTSLQRVNFYRVVQAAMKVEKLETSCKEKSQKEHPPLLVKELEMFKPSRYRVRLQEVEDKEVQQYLVRVEVLQLDREKSQSALISIDDIRVFAGYGEKGVFGVEALSI